MKFPHKKLVEAGFIMYDFKDDEIHYKNHSIGKDVSIEVTTEYKPLKQYVELNIKERYQKIEVKSFDDLLLLCKLLNILK